MTALIQGLEVHPGILWKYIYFFTIEFLFLINDEGCYVCRDHAKFNPMNVIFFTFFHFAKELTKKPGFTVEHLLTMIDITKRLNSTIGWFLQRHHSTMNRNFKKILAFVKKPDDSRAYYLLKSKRGAIRDFKEHSQYLNRMKLGIIQRKKGMEKKE